MAVWHQHAADVAEGRVVTGALEATCYAQWLAEESAPPEGYEFRPDLGAAACDFVEHLRVTDGPKRGEPLHLIPWQVALLMRLFGWIDPVSGFRRFREASIWLSKGQGKSPLGAAVALLILAKDRGAPKAFSAATTRKQARAVWEHAQQMVELDAPLREAFSLYAEQHAIRSTRDNRVYEPVSSEAGSIEGIRPAVVVLDEVHILPDARLYNNVRTACNKCDGALFFQISTAGVDDDSVGKRAWERARDIILGKAVEPTTLAFIAAADEGDDPYVESTWRKANPSLGVTVSLVGLRAAAARAREMPDEEQDFLVKHLGLWTQSQRAWVQSAPWAASSRPDVVDEIFSTTASLDVGVDLSEKLDLTAVVSIATRLRDDGNREYGVRCRAYLPEKSPTLAKLPQLRRWAEQGFLTLTPGNAILHQTEIAPDLVAIEAEHPGSRYWFDPAKGGSQLGTWLIAKHQMTAVDFKSNPLAVTPVLAELSNALDTSRLHHDGNPLLAWAMANLTVESRSSGLNAIGKDAPLRKIDPAVALLNALNGAMKCDPAQSSGGWYFDPLSALAAEDA